jgi:acyl-CoA reductase-like NAD-dependent aldehyde dehydrogenase
MVAIHPLLVVDAVSSGEPLVVNAAFDGQPIAELDTADGECVERALATAYSLYRDRQGWLELDQRAAILERTAVLMAQQSEALAVEAAREGGKPLIDSRVEVTRAIDGIKICIEVMRAQAGKVIPMGTTAASRQRLAFTRKEPIGVVVAVSAFNHPLNLIVHQVAAAVATGCPVVVKPADDTPLSCYTFVKLLHEAGLPPGWCQALVTDDLATAQALVTDPRVAFFTFIGSAKVGWMLRSQLAPGTRCALEHGGAAPVILEADADWELALPALTKGGFYHAGQVCVSVQRVFAPAAQAVDFAAALASLASQLRIGDPVDEQTEVGPLIRPREVQRVAAWVDEAIGGGGQRITGGDPLGPTTYPCTVLLNPPKDANVSRQEIFGPVVCVYSYENVTDAYVAANDLPFSFQAAVFTRDLDKALAAYQHLDASAVMVNDHTAFRVDAMPFAGLRQSGLGTGGIPYTMEDMTVDKMLVVKSGVL